MAGVIAHSKAIISSANARILVTFMIVLLPLTTRNNDTPSSDNLSSTLTMSAVTVITALRRCRQLSTLSHDYGIRAAIYASNMLEAPTSREVVALRGNRLEYFTIAWNSLEGLIALVEDYGLAPAFLMGLDLRALCNDEEVQMVHTFLETVTEDKPTWMTFVRARGVGDHVEEDAGRQLEAFRHGFDLHV